MDWSSFSKTDLELLTTPEILNRGLTYLGAGHVLQTFRFGTVLAGKIAGTAAFYKARLWLSEGGPRGECSCPYGGFCKHLAALALAWLEAPERFVDLRPRLDDLLEHRERAALFLTRLATLDPAGFAEFWPDRDASPAFAESRALMNLVRTAFSYPQFTMDGARQLWAKLEHLSGLIGERLRAGDSEALGPLLELLDGMIATLKTGKYPVLEAGFRELLQLVAELAPTLSAIAGLALVRRLFGYSCDPELWEYQDALRAAIRAYLGQNGQAAAFLPELAGAAVAGDFLRLVAVYELLATCPDEPGYRELHHRVAGELQGMESGRLWLIDRLLEGDPDQAFRIARAGLREAGDGPSRMAFRERLIRIHLARGEPKQAAVLSFAQFGEAPDYHEYLRLKMILEPLPGAWADAWRRLAKFLAERGMTELLMQCAAHEGDAALLTEHWTGLSNDPDLALKLAEEFSAAFRAELSIFYPPLFRVLADRGEPLAWKAAIRILGLYKKHCLASGQEDQWRTFRDSIVAEYPNDRRFSKGGVFS
ncbi:putative Zn finger protein [Hydrogenispora ethanolica]|jgi:hypothetical protein|uniref:Putative Zn finger protein n=1 Tax=Hydrogenispora ethanolica TaxID=1082276 RepID=A0A4R1SAN9_HYDET|nr:SWIM zinc finger family protein [Hydrogenispora ethanolica]TCL76518.1 putative Zn finger protein [Hydrogenispora ethanolica]